MDTTAVLQADTSTGHATASTPDLLASGVHWLGHMVASLFGSMENALVVALAAVIVNASIRDRLARRWRHHTALARLQVMLNRNINAARYIKTQIVDFTKAAEAGALHRGRFRALLADDASGLDLLNGRLVNEIFTYNSEAGRINQSIEDLMETYYEMRRAYLSDAELKPDFIETARATAEDFVHVDLAVDGFLELTERALASVRILYRRDVPTLRRVFLPASGEVLDTDIEAESKVLKVEMDKTIEQTKAVIAERKEKAKAKMG